MASPTQWTWVRASSRRWWRKGKPGMLQFMKSQRVGHDWVTKQVCLCRAILLIHPDPSLPSLYPCICSLHLCLFLLENKFIYIVFLDSTYKQYYTIFVFIFFTHFTQYASLCVHPHLCKLCNFIFMCAISFLCMYMYIFFTHPSVGGHLSCFHFLAIVNCAAVNIEVHVSLWIMVFCQYIHRSWIAESCGSFIFSFLRKLILFYIMAVSI